MKVAITGHTRGIGLAISNYFTDKNFEVLGFSRSNGFDISDQHSRDNITLLSKDCDVFVNNSYNDFDDSQLKMLSQIAKQWKGFNKTIINISSRWTTDSHQYCKTKNDIDNFCKNIEQDKLYILNLKPGLTDTDRVQHIQGEKMQTATITKIIDFALDFRSNCRIHSISFGSDR